MSIRTVICRGVRIGVREKGDPWQAQIVLARRQDDSLMLKAPIDLISIVASGKRQDALPEGQSLS